MRSRSFWRREQGAAAVEFALIISLFLVLAFAVIDFGFGFHAWIVTGNGSREGARVGATSDDVNEIQQKALQASASLPGTPAVTVECRPGGVGAPGPCPPQGSWVEGDDVIVTVSYTHTLVTPLGALAGLGTTLDFTSVSEARFEGL